MKYQLGNTLPTLSRWWGVGQRPLAPVRLTEGYSPLVNREQPGNCIEQVLPPAQPYEIPQATGLRPSQADRIYTAT